MSALQSGKTDVNPTKSKVKYEKLSNEKLDQTLTLEEK
jgi:hypothetical protein